MAVSLESGEINFEIYTKKTKTNYKKKVLYLSIHLLFIVFIYYVQYIIKKKPNLFFVLIKIRIYIYIHSVITNNLYLKMYIIYYIIFFFVNVLWN